MSAGDRQHGAALLLALLLLALGSAYTVTEQWNDRRNHLRHSPGDAAKPGTLRLEMTRRAALPFTSLLAARSGTRQ